MKIESCRSTTAAIMLATLMAGPAASQEFSSGSDSEMVETPRSGPSEPMAGTRAVPLIEADREASRAPMLDPEAAREAFSIIGRTRGGEDVRMEPGEDVMRAIEGERPGDDERGALESEQDPEHAETDRGVIGGDDRVRISDSTQYPYRTTGLLEMTDADGTGWNCTATLIGAKTLLTAAHCLYDHGTEGGWYENYVFWPALNGASNAPYGGWEYETVYVFNAYVDQFDGTYDSVWAYDYGIIELAEPIGDTLGWLGTWNYTDLGDFDASVLGYHDDKEDFTLWRSSCNVPADMVSDYDFLHDCDLTGGSSGAPVYVYDRAAAGRYIVGVNVGASDQVNWALRVTQPVVEWIQAIIAQE